MIVATLPEPTVRPPSRSDGVEHSNQYVTFLYLFIHLLYVFLALFCFSSSNVYQIRITNYLLPFSANHIPQSFLQQLEL